MHLFAQLSGVRFENVAARVRNGTCDCAESSHPTSVCRAFEDVLLAPRSTPSRERARADAVSTLHLV